MRCEALCGSGPEEELMFGIRIPYLMVFPQLQQRQNDRTKMV